MMKTAAAVLALSAALLSGCYSDKEIADANAVMTALPQEVTGCKFLADVDTSGARAAIGAARFSLKYETSKLGGTHLVETHAWPGILTHGMIGVGLSGRAYKCSDGLGPKTENPEAQLKYDIPSWDSLFPDDEFFSAPVSDGMLWDGIGAPGPYWWHRRSML